jgi:hypothetical protein
MRLLDDATSTSGLKMETVCFSKTLVSTYESTQHHNQEEQHRHLHHHENLKSSTSVGTEHKMKGKMFMNDEQGIIWNKASLNKPINPVQEETHENLSHDTW